MLVDDRVKTSNVKVITENGEVFLLGSVTESQGAAAAEIASRTQGAVKVIKVCKYLN